MHSQLSNDAIHVLTTTTMLVHTALILHVSWFTQHRTNSYDVRRDVHAHVRLRRPYALYRMHASVSAVAAVRGSTCYVPLRDDRDAPIQLMRALRDPATV